MATKEEKLEDAISEDIILNISGVQETMERVKTSFVEKVNDSKKLGNTFCEIISKKLTQNDEFSMEDIVLSLGYTLSNCAKSCCDTEEEFKSYEKRATEVVSNNFLQTIQPNYITDPDDPLKLIIDKTTPFNENDFHPASFMLYCSNLINYFVFQATRSSVGK